MISPVLYSSVKTEWETPPELFDALNQQFHFTLDAAAQPHNAKCARYFTPEQDGLAQSWAGETVWVNPPYGREISKWVRKAHDESQQHGITVVLLLPVRTDTKWFQDYCLNDAWGYCFLRGRIRFVGAPGPAPFPSMLVCFCAGDPKI